VSSDTGRLTTEARRAQSFGRIRAIHRGDAENTEFGKYDAKIADTDNVSSLCPPCLCGAIRKITEIDRRDVENAKPRDSPQRRGEHRGLYRE
jgi:hypothetical protein